MSEPTGPETAKQTMLNRSRTSATDTASPGGDALGLHQRPKASPERPSDLASRDQASPKHERLALQMVLQMAWLWIDYGWSWLDLALAGLWLDLA